MQPLLVVRGLRRAYGDHVVLDGFDLTVDAGEAVALVGPNGSGKTTLLRSLTGVDRADDGEVLLAGHEVDERDPGVRAAVAAVTDDLDFFPDLSVVEHLELVARAHRTPDAEQVVDGVLAELGLVEMAGRLPGSLSSGQRRRLALATAFVRPRRLLVLDEPEQRLDVEGLTWLEERLRREVSDGVAVVLASHRPSLVEAVGARRIELGHG